MVTPDPSLRPSSSSLVKHSFLHKRNTKTSISKELQETRKKLEEMRKMMGRKKRKTRRMRLSQRRNPARQVHEPELAFHPRSVSLVQGVSPMRPSGRRRT